ncbi:S-layer homology domain-containing protein [Trichocoleus sp. FACHB-90]|uniref:S-layer homology domain-containing protein n=1 Tax=Cyanophyceae TaxID=3028117 RepID=UPI001687EACA|nr:S-layer homology domain-containing protein [Trichocoleus sp. FACHB-90]MBD1925231.1 S-layer homology domain-containing protein [Trichocoleus sp. FACHB-90]
MRRVFSTLSLLALLQYFPAAVNAQQTQPSELPSDPVERVIAAKLMTNYPDGNFYSEQIISRAELASILVKTFNLDKREGADKPGVIEVQDVPPSHWAYKDIQTVLKTGIMKGYRKNLFFPNQKINRAEAFSILAQAHGVFQFNDETVQTIIAQHPDAGNIPDWAKKSMATAIYERFINTDEQGNIYPLNPMSRGDMAYALSQFLERQQITAPLLPEDSPFPGSSRDR